MRHLTYNELKKVETNWVDNPSDLAREMVARKRKAGELGIELAKTLTLTLSPFGGGWSRKASTDEMNALIERAQKVIDTLEGRNG